MPTNWELTEGTRNFFWGNLAKMSPSYQWHYCERLFRITGDKKYTKPINEYVLSQIEHITKLIAALDDQKIQSAFGLKFISKYRQSTVPRIRNRIPIYEKNLTFLYYQELLFLLNKLQDYKLQDYLGTGTYTRVITKLRNTNLEQYFVNPELIKADPVQTINMAFHAQKLLLGDIPSPLIKLTNQIFENATTDTEFQNKLYYLTHIILSASHYYQRFISNNRYKWIFTYFNQEIRRIFRIPNDDLLLEIGICYKLAQKENRDLKTYLQTILKQVHTATPPILFRADITLEENTIHKFEHRNVLAIIYSSPFNKLYPGPQIIV